jgi:hypothetical protein
MKQTLAAKETRRLSIENAVQGLNGHEIISDLCYHVQKQLQRDCNLTPMCSYEGGYEAEVTVKMKLHGIDIEKVDTMILVGVKDQRPGTVIEEEVKIGRDERLDQVRTRSEQAIPNPTLEKLPENPLETQAPPKGSKGRFQKATPHPIGAENSGGATGETLERE